MKQIGAAIVICFSISMVSFSVVVPHIPRTTCSQLVTCCMRLWGEMRFQDTLGDVTVWSENARNCLTHLHELTQKVKDDHHDGLTRENVEYIIHLVDRISVECEHAVEQSGSEGAQRAFLAQLVALWAHVRSVVLEV